MNKVVAEELYNHFKNKKKISRGGRKWKKKII